MASTRLWRYAWFVLLLNILVILWGAFVRATGSGAGCGSHWPTCNGEIIPRSPRLETIIEASHRASSGLALIAVVALVVWVWRSFPRGHVSRRLAGFSMLFMLGEAAVGAILVLFQLVEDNASMARAWVGGAHLVNTFLLLAALTLTARFLGPGPALSGPRLFRREHLAVYLGLLGICLVGASGGISALGDTLFPATDLKSALARDFAPGEHFLIRLRVLHPLFAVAVGLYLLFFVRSRPQPGLSAREHRVSNWLAILVLLQFGAGTLNVIFLAPIWLQLLHLLLADCLWVTVVLLLAERLSTLSPRLSPAP